jgi:hypothetical protein
MISQANRHPGHATHLSDIRSKPFAPVFTCQIHSLLLENCLQASFLLYHLLRHITRKVYLGLNFQDHSTRMTPFPALVHDDRIKISFDSESDLKGLESIISNLAGHDKWLIRASTVERIGDLQLRRRVVRVGSMRLVVAGPTTRDNTPGCPRRYYRDCTPKASAIA